MFAEVHLRVPHPDGAVTIPGTVLVTNAGGTQVILTSADGRLHEGQEVEAVKALSAAKGG